MLLRLVKITILSFILKIFLSYCKLFVTNSFMSEHKNDDISCLDKWYLDYYEDKDAKPWDPSEIMEDVYVEERQPNALGTLCTSGTSTTLGTPSISGIRAAPNTPNTPMSLKGSQSKFIVEHVNELDFPQRDKLEVNQYDIGRRISSQSMPCRKKTDNSFLSFNENYPDLFVRRLSMKESCRLRHHSCGGRSGYSDRNESLKINKFLLFFKVWKKRFLQENDFDEQNIFIAVSLIYSKYFED